MAKRGGGGDPNYGRIAVDDSDPTKRYMWMGEAKGGWVPVARDNTPLSPQMLSTDATADAGVLQASAKAGKTGVDAIPNLVRLLRLVNDKKRTVGAFAPVQAWINNAVPWAFSGQAEKAQALKGLAKKTVAPMMKDMTPATDTDFQNMLDTIVQSDSQRAPAAQSVQQLIYEANRAAWRDKILRDWVKNYGSPTRAASQPFDNTPAAAGETFDQYYSRWADKNAKTLYHPQGAYAPQIVRPLAQPGAPQAMPQGQAMPQQQPTVDELLARYGSPQ